MSAQCWEQKGRCSSAAGLPQTGHFPRRFLGSNLVISAMTDLRSSAAQYLEALAPVAGLGAELKGLAEPAFERLARCLGLAVECCDHRRRRAPAQGPAGCRIRLARGGPEDLVGDRDRGLEPRAAVAGSARFQ